MVCRHRLFLVIGMVKKKKYFVLGIFCILAMIAVVMIENKKVTPEKTYISNAETEVKDAPNAVEDESDDVDNDETDKNNNTLYVDGIEIEVLGCEMIEDTDISKQTKYSQEFFYSGEVPDAEYLIEYIDYEAIKEECPELQELWENESDSTDIEHVKEVYNRHLDVIEKHTTMIHPKTRYYFVRCKMTNTKQKKYNACLDVYIFVKGEGEYLYMQRGACYFDKAVYLEGDERVHNFFWYPIAEGEVLECVLGFEIQEVWNEEEKYYVGVQTPGVDNFTLDNIQSVQLIELEDEDE